MEDSGYPSTRYETLVWLLLTEYKDSGYTPSRFLLDTVKPHLDSTGLPVQIYDSTVYDFRIARGFKDYLDMFLNKTKMFESALVVLSFSDKKYISRDYYMANLAKQYTCWDTAYVNCPAGLVESKAFTYVIDPSNMPSGLVEVIRGKV